MCNRENIFFILIVASFIGCVAEEPYFLSGFGKKPVYASQEEFEDIKNLTQQPSVNSGPIFLLDSYLYIAELGKGIHVHGFDIKDSTNTGYVTFIKVPGITDFYVIDRYIYADAWTDILVIDIGDIDRVKLVNRLENEIAPLLFPPQYRGIFECIDRDKGIVVDWEDAYLENVKCTAL